MKATICDFCKKPIIDDPKLEVVLKIGAGYPLDICEDCFHGSVNLSEQRRMRRGKAKPKLGRPRGRKPGLPSGLPPDEQLAGQAADPNTPREPVVLSDQTKSVIRRRAAQRGISPPEQPAV